MHPILLVLRREFLVRVRKTSFWVLTFVGPILFAAVTIIPSLLAFVTVDTKKVLVVDESKIFLKSLKSEDKLTFAFSENENIEQVKRTYETDGFDALLYIPKMTVDKTVNPSLYSVNSLGINTEERIVSSLEDEIKTRRLNSAGIDPKKLKAIEPHISLSTKELSKEGSSEKDKSTGAATAAGYISGFLIYMFIFIYGSMVMRGVVEEKTNRIIEIIISTVRPFHLMMGKVLGISAVAVVQLIMWVVFTMAISSGASIVMGLMMDKEQIAQVTSSGNPVEMNGTISSEAKEKIKATTESKSADMFDEVKKAAATINIPLILGCFMFYFIGGYLVYAGLFAAIGSAVDSETDAQQLTGPISIPLIIGFIASQLVIQNPDSGFGIALSLFPLTSPITMMMRIPFGVPTWQLITSMVLLIVTFVGTIWLSGRIFRVGILLFGKKPTWKQMIIWVFRKD